MVNYVKFSKDANVKNLRKDILENPAKFLTATLKNRYMFGVDTICDTGVYKEMGFAYDLRDQLNKFLYKQYGSWHEIYAINKANVRKLIGGRIDKIINLTLEKF